MTLLNRRRFLQWAGAATAAGLVHPAGARAADPSGPKVRLGVIGCGGRGKFVAGLMEKHGGYTFTAAADYFPDRVNELGDRFGIPADRRFTGLDGWKKLLDSPVDAVLLTEPPFFRPTHAAAAIEAGKHAYLAKPVAVDVPGCKVIEDTGHKATAARQVMLVDFQTRADPFYCQALQHIRQGAMGSVTFIDAKYHGGQLRPRATPDGSPQARLRNWVFDIALSGDIITEQFVHSLDVASWVLDRPPIDATATCARKVRTQVGDCHDCFAGLIRYDDHVGCTFSGKQYNDGATNEGIVVNAFGTRGRLLTKYGGRVVLYGKPYYKGGLTSEIYRTGAAANVAEFHRRITTGQYDNPTIGPSVRSTLLTILFRTAAYTGTTVRWADLLKSTERLDGRLEGLKA